MDNSQNADQAAGDTNDQTNENGKNLNNTFDQINAADSSDEEEDIIPAESKISKTLSDQTTKTVVLLVLLLLFMLAGCSIESYVDTTMMHQQGLKNLVYLYDLGDKHWADYQKAYIHYRDTTLKAEYPLIFVQLPDPFSQKYTSELYEQ